jgi:DNA-binding NarL/FixJ family response regulator
MRSASTAPTGKISVCLVEHNPLAARYLARLLANEAGLAVLTHDALLEARRPARNSVHVFLLDSCALPDSLSRYLRFLRLRFPSARALLLGHPLPTEELCRLLFLGIQGFLAYDDVEAQLPRALRALAAGHLWVEPSVLEQYVRYSNQLARLREEKSHAFTRREKRILELVKRRLTNKEIGAILAISESTVKFHLSNLFAKLGVRDRHAVVEVASAHAPRALFPQVSS